VDAQPDKLKSVADEVARAEKSPILLSGIQKGERISQVKEDSIRQLYDEKQRNLMKRRLEEMAYLFWKLEEENLARISLRCALSFLERDSLLKVNAFLKALMEKAFFSTSRERAFLTPPAVRVHPLENPCALESLNWQLLRAMPGGCQRTSVRLAGAVSSESQPSREGLCHGA